MTADTGPRLPLSAMIVDTKASMGVSTGPKSDEQGLVQISFLPPPPCRKGRASSAPLSSRLQQLATYGHASFRVLKEDYAGLVTPGMEDGDMLAVLLAEDDPVVLRSLGARRRSRRLLREYFVRSEEVMGGSVVESGSVGV
ncbi:hypothetical protein Q7P37_007891 [Cladosporium fusiforme]